jgi:hypothetical protein
MRFPTRELPPIHVPATVAYPDFISAELARLAREATSSQIIRAEDGSLIHVFALPQGE